MFGWFRSLGSKSSEPSLGGGAVDAFRDLIGSGNRLLDEGRLKEAILAYRQAVECRPEEPSARVNLAYTLIDDGAFNEAMGHLEYAIKLDAANADAYYMLGKVFKHRGQADRAIEYIDKSISLNVAYEYAYTDLFKLYMAKNDLPTAIEVIEKGIQKYPQIAEYHCALGDAYKASGNLQQAILCYQKALGLSPKLYEAHNGLGIAYLEQKNWKLAAESFLLAIAITPEQGYAYSNLGIAFEKRGKLPEAIEQYQKALSILPDAYPVINNLANALRFMGRNDESIALRRSLVERYPKDISARDNFLFDLSYYPQAVPGDYLREAIEYGKLLTSVAKPFRQWRAGQGEPGRSRLRIGFVSGDFCNHPVGFFLENVIRHLPRGNLELVAYPTTSEEDQLTARLKAIFDEWHCLSDLSDEAAAKKIHGDGIGVLIDLSGHTKSNRLPVFAWKPAPVQISWLGFFASTGVAEMDYVIADRISVPEEIQDQFTESIHYLPDTRLCFSPPDITTEVSPLPAKNTGRITFGCFQGLTKINAGVMKAWAEVLRLLPDARLRLQSMYLGFPEMDKYLLDRLDHSGIDLGRVSLLGSVPRDAYLAAHSEVDIILDTFPYTGGTTTCEALWMGVPTVTLMGGSMLSRQGASLLAYAGLEDWIAHNIDEYIGIAVERASHQDRLAEMRKGLRGRIAASPLFDAPGFAENFACALDDIWRASGKK